MAPPLQTCVARIYAPYRIALREFIHHTELRREHGDGASQVLGILRAERSSAPTDLRCENLYTIQNCVASMPTVCRKCWISCGRSAAPPLQTFIVMSYIITMVGQWGQCLNAKRCLICCVVVSARS